MGRGGFDEIAQNVIMFDFQRSDFGQGTILGLHLRNHPAAFVAQMPGMVQIRLKTCGHETPITQQQGEIFVQCF